MKNIIRIRSLTTREKVFAFLLLLPCFSFVATFAFYPILYSFYLSLHNIILTFPGLGQPFVGFENYKNLIQDKVAIHSLTNTIIFVIITVMLEVFCGLIIALIINRQFRARGWVRAAILVPWAIPTVVASQMWRFIFNDNYGFFNFILFGSNVAAYRAWLAEPLFAFSAIMLADIWKTSPFAALIILAGLQTIPDDLYESAKIEGANAWQRFKKITLPLIKPALLIALLFRTMDAFRVFDLVFVMTQGGPADATNVLQFYGYKKIFAEGFMGYGSTISVIVFLITFLICLFYIRVIGTRLFQYRG